jgi:hypothetical protein
MTDRKSDEEYIASIRGAVTISPETRKSYEKGLKRVLKLVTQGRQKKKTVDIGWIVRHATRAFALIEQGVENRSSLRTLVATILAVLKHAGVKKEHPRIFSKWYEIYKPLKRETDGREKLSQAEGRLLKAAVKWEDVLSARDALEYGSKDHLLLSMYTYIPPRRQEDYYKVRILSSLPHPHGYKKEPSYIDMTREPMRLTVTEYKTAKSYQDWTKDLTDATLADIIRTSVSQSPREYMFTQKNGSPFKTANAFTCYSNRALKKHVGPNVTVNSLRHAAAKASLTDPNKTDQEQEEYALDMGHSYEMHRKYRKVISEEAYASNKVRPK